MKKHKLMNWVVITLTPYMVLPLFATRFADYAGGIEVFFIQPCLFNLIENVLPERYIIQTYRYGIHKHVFRICTIWDAWSFMWINYCGFTIQLSCSDVCGDHRRPQTLAEIRRNMGICYGFRSVAARVKYPGFMSLVLYRFITYSAPRHYLNR